MGLFNDKYMVPTEETQEEVDAHVNSLPDAEFNQMVVSWLMVAATTGCSPFYQIKNTHLSQFMEEFVDGPEQTPNAKTFRALARRMARTLGLDISAQEAEIERLIARPMSER